MFRARAMGPPQFVRVVSRPGRPGGAGRAGRAVVRSLPDSAARGKLRVEVPRILHHLFIVPRPPRFASPRRGRRGAPLKYRTPAAGGQLPASLRSEEHTSE